MSQQVIMKIADSLTEDKLSEDRKLFKSLVNKMHPEGTTFLKHLKKIPKENNPDQFVYEYELSEAVISFMTLMSEKYSDKDLRVAISSRILSDAN